MMVFHGNESIDSMPAGSLFDESFMPLAVHDEGDRLLAIDLAVLKAGASYVLHVATQEVYEARSDKGAEPAEAGAFVLDTTEIFVEDTTRSFF